MVLNPNNPFQVVDQTETINKLPIQYGRAIAAKIFNGGGGAVTTSIRIFREKGRLSVVPVKVRGAEPSTRRGEKRDAFYLDIPHYPVNTRVEAQGVQNVVGADGKTLTTFAIEKARAFAGLKRDLEITKEWLLCCALRGLLLDNDGTSVIYNLFDEFQVTKKTIHFDFSSADLNVREECMNVSRHIEDNLLGDTMTHTEVWTSPEFFDQLVKHSSVVEVFKGYQEASERLGGDPRKGFSFGGLKFSEYRGKAPGKDGAMLQFVPSNKAQAFPMGTMDTFSQHFAPPVLDGINKANTIGQEMYAMETIDNKGRWAELDAEMDILPLCRRPEVLVELTMTAAA